MVEASKEKPDMLQWALLSKSNDTTNGVETNEKVITYWLKQTIDNFSKAYVLFKN